MIVFKKLSEPVDTKLKSFLYFSKICEGPLSFLWCKSDRQTRDYVLFSQSISSMLPILLKPFQLIQKQQKSNKSMPSHSTHCLDPKSVGIIVCKFILGFTSLCPKRVPRVRERHNLFNSTAEGNTSKVFLERGDRHGCVGFKSVSAPCRGH